MLRNPLAVVTRSRPFAASLICRTAVRGPIDRLHPIAIHIEQPVRRADPQDALFGKLQVGDSKSRLFKRVDFDRRQGEPSQSGRGYSQEP